MRPTRSIVHVVGGNYLVFYSELEKSQDVFRAFALKGVEVFYLELVKFVPLEF